MHFWCKNQLLTAKPKWLTETWHTVSCQANIYSYYMYKYQHDMFIWAQTYPHVWRKINLPHMVTTAHHLAKMIKLYITRCTSSTYMQGSQKYAQKCPKTHKLLTQTLPTASCWNIQNYYTHKYQHDPFTSSQKACSGCKINHDTPTQ